VFVVGCLGDQRSAAKVLFESESLQRYSAKGKATRQGTASDVEEGVGSGDDNRLLGSNIVGSLNTSDAKMIGTQYVNENKCVVELFVKTKRAQSTTDNETWVEGVVAPTQNAFDVGDVRATTAILFENHPNDSRVTGPHDVAPSCVSRYGTGGGNVPLVIPIQDSKVIEKNQNGIGVGNEASPAYTIDQTGAQAVAIQGTVIGRQDHNGPQGSGCSDGGEMFTLTNRDTHAVAFQQNTRDEVRLMNGDGQIAGALASESGMKQQNYLASTTMQVRRLTPTECERLQGFPYGWTAIPWKKKLADDCPDGPRYKALGNSMAVNCMEWIGQRINAIQTQS
jgi:site-specific DNA-cytosine methylase